MTKMWRLTIETASKRSFLGSGCSWRGTGVKTSRQSLVHRPVSSVSPRRLAAISVTYLGTYIEPLAWLGRAQAAAKRIRFGLGMVPGREYISPPSASQLPHNTSQCNKRSDARFNTPMIERRPVTSLDQPSQMPQYPPCNEVPFVVFPHVVAYRIAAEERSVLLALPPPSYDAALPTRLPGLTNAEQFTSARIQHSTGLKVKYMYCVARTSPLPISLAVSTSPFLHLQASWP